eukprot:2085749-Prymnesium_polylepis.1
MTGRHRSRGWLRIAAALAHGVCAFPASGICMTSLWGDLGAVATLGFATALGRLPLSCLPSARLTFGTFATFSARFGRLPR